MIICITILKQVSCQALKKAKSRSFTTTKAYRIKLRRFGLHDLLSRNDLSDAYMLRNRLHYEMNKMRIEIKNEQLAREEEEEAMRQKELQKHFRANGVKSKNFMMDFHTMRLF